MSRCISWTIQSALAACCFLLAASACASSVTVVTHGADFSGAGGPLWDLGLGIYEYWAAQPGGAVEYAYNKETLELSVARGGAANEHTVVVFDWAAESDRSQGGYDEAAGDAMFAMLHANNLLGSDFLHLVGHSRGAVVVSEAAQRILHYGYPVHQLTFLDYEAGPVPYNDAGPAYGWEGIGRVDSYFGDGGNLLGLGGHPVVQGAVNIHIAGVDHVDFPEWYTGTIHDPTAFPGYPVRLYEGPIAPPDTPPVPVAPPPGVVNGDFQFGVVEVPGTGVPAEASATSVAGWNYHGGAGTAHVDYLDLSDYDLEIDAGDTSKLHNWLYAPEDAYQLVFDAKGEIAILQADEFWVYLRSHDNAQHHEYHVFNTNRTTADKGWETYQLPLTSYADSVFRFSFNLTAPGINFVDSQVQVDNVHFLRYALADFNRDAVVNDVDLATWTSCGGIDAGGDADHDGDTDGADFLAWQRQFGSGPVEMPAQRAIPEPATATLALLAAIVLIVWRGDIPYNHSLRIVNLRRCLR